MLQLTFRKSLIFIISSILRCDVDYMKQWKDNQDKAGKNVTALETLKTEFGGITEKDKEITQEQFDKMISGGDDEKKLLKDKFQKEIVGKKYSDCEKKVNELVDNLIKDWKKVSFKMGFNTDSTNFIGEGEKTVKDIIGSIGETTDNKDARDSWIKDLKLDANDDKKKFKKDAWIKLCGKNVSSVPGGGKKPWYKRAIFIVPLVLLLILIVAAIVWAMM